LPTKTLAASLSQAAHRWSSRQPRRRRPATGSAAQSRSAPPMSFSLQHLQRQATGSVVLCGAFAPLAPLSQCRRVRRGTGSARSAPAVKPAHLTAQPGRAPARLSRCHSRRYAAPARAALAFSMPTCVASRIRPERRATAVQITMSDAERSPSASLATPSWVQRCRRQRPRLIVSAARCHPGRGCRPRDACIFGALSTCPTLSMAA